MKKINLQNIKTLKGPGNFDAVIERNYKDGSKETVKINSKKLADIPEETLNLTRKRRKYFYLDYGEKLFMFD